MAPTRHEFKVASGLRIVGDAWGDPAGRPVVFLHGGGQTRHAWGGTAEAVAATGAWALALDHRGHGDSDWHPGGEYDLPGFVADLASIVDTLPRRPILVGASLGGLTALVAETDVAAGLAHALVLVDVTPRLEIRGVQRIIAFMSARPDGFASLDEAADFIASFLPDRPRPRDLSGLAKNLRQRPDGRWHWHWDQKLLRVWNPEHGDPELGQELLRRRLSDARRITIPTLLVRGRMSDVVSPEGAREFLELVPHAEFVDLERAGHMVAGDRNDAFTSTILDFVRRVA